MLNLLNIEQLVATTKEIYKRSTVMTVMWMIAVIRDRLITNQHNLIYPDRNITHVNGEFTIYRQVIKQDLGSLVILIVLLLVALGSVVCISLLIPSKTILLRAPSSITAQLSFLAGSRLVNELREEGVVKTTDINI